MKLSNALLLLVGSIASGASAYNFHTDCSTPSLRNRGGTLVLHAHCWAAPYADMTCTELDLNNCFANNNGMLISKNK